MVGHHGPDSDCGGLGGSEPPADPEWFAPRLVDFLDRPYGPFAHSLTLTQGGDVVLVPTPGHTRGHLSVVVQETDRAVVLAGDTSYTQGLLLAHALDGVGPDELQEHATHRRILQLAQSMPTVYLPTHDPESAERLAQRQVLSVVDVASSLSIA
jgi:N-acyl homoserine lactone hydrolase